MPRNSQGTYSLPSTPLQDNTTIVVAPHNANYQDLGAEITNSLDRTGKGGMTGQFKAANGTAPLPGMAYVQDPDTGWRRSGANTNTAVAGGADVFDIDEEGITLKSGKSIKGGDGSVIGFPTGTRMLFAQTAAPVGWTKDTEHNDKALRIVSGDASSGGTTPFTTVFGARTINRNNLPNVSLDCDGSTGPAGQHRHFTATTGANSATLTDTNALVRQGSNYTLNGSGTAASVGQTNLVSDHIHTFEGETESMNGGVTQQAMDFAVQYVDVIIAVRD